MIATLKNGLAAGRERDDPGREAEPGGRCSCQIGQLPGIRDAIDFGAMNASQAFQAYNGIVDAQFRFFDSQATINDSTSTARPRRRSKCGRALEMVGREAALVGEALAAHGQMNAADHNLFVQTLANQRFLEAEALSQLSGRLAAALQAALRFAGVHRRSRRWRTRSPRARAGARLPVNPVAWQSGVQSVPDGLQPGGGLVRQAVTQGLQQAGSGILLGWPSRPAPGCLRSSSRPSSCCGSGAASPGNSSACTRPRASSPTSGCPGSSAGCAAARTSTSRRRSPPLYPGKTTEIANVAQAFSTVQRTAVEAAVGQAQLRKGVNQVFLNLARRNQSLLHRQLDMLDSMERSTADPEALENFFRLDHLTTRMRRNAEGLIILSGEVPGRGWRSPVRVLDVLRAAIAEVEDYVRVDVVNESRDAIVGTAVADIIHLLAELIENATAFSPPNTRVTVSADRVGSGFAVEVEDRGLGISPGELAEINKRLASPPEFDLADSDRLGLFVVGQLATRHQIKVSLVESPFGGTTAVVLMPHTIVVPESDLDSVDGNGHGGHGNGHGGHGNGHGGHGGHGGAQAGLRAAEGLAAATPPRGSCPGSTDLPRAA